MNNKCDGCEKEEQRACEPVDGDYPSFTLKDKIVFILLGISALGLGLYFCMTQHG